MGCAPEPRPTRIGYYLPRPRDLARIHRVAMVELEHDGPCPRLGRDMTQALVKAIQDRILFHVKVVRADDPRLGELPSDLQGCKTLKDLALLRKAFNCDALLVGSICRFEPHPRMQLGLYLQLLDLRRGRLVWGLEHTWDTADRATRLRIREFFRNRRRDDHGVTDWHLALMSPKAFEKYVAFEVADTLRGDPPVVRPARDAMPEVAWRNFRRILDD